MTARMMTDEEREFGEDFGKIIYQSHKGADHISRYFDEDDGTLAKLNKAQIGVVQQAEACLNHLRRTEPQKVSGALDVLFQYYLDLIDTLKTDADKIFALKIRAERLFPRTGSTKDDPCI